MAETKDRAEVFENSNSVSKVNIFLIFEKKILKHLSICLEN